MRTDIERLDWLSKQSGCALLEDDNGHWAVVWDGIQEVPLGDESQDMWTSFFVEKHQWKNSAREAIDDAISRELIDNSINGEV